MRGVAVGVLVIALFTVYPIPAADACSIHVHDPKNPNFSEDCKDPENWTEDGTTYASVDTEGITQLADEETGICDVNKRVCQAALNASIEFDRSGDSQVLELGVDVDGLEPLSPGCETVTTPVLDKGHATVC